MDLKVQRIMKLNNSDSLTLLTIKDLIKSLKTLSIWVISVNQLPNIWTHSQNQILEGCSKVIIHRLLISLILNCHLHLQDSELISQTTKVIFHLEQLKSKYLTNQPWISLLRLNKTNLNNQGRIYLQLNLKLFLNMIILNKVLMNLNIG